MKEKIEEMYINALNEDLPPNVFADELLALFSVSQFNELLLQAYKDGFDSATESVVAANKMVQERKLQ